MTYHSPNLTDVGAGERRTFRVKEAAMELGVSDSSIRRLIKRGELRAINKLRHVLIPASEIERFLKVRD